MITNMAGVIFVNSFVIFLVVLIHYEFLSRLSALIPRLDITHRYRIIVSVFGALAAHTVEIWIFALAYYFMHHAEGWGHFEGNFSGALLDAGYFSFTTYTTLGFGDIEPFGDLRYLTGLEALTGLVLITWTASFVYFEKQR